jgi:ABC-type transporter MlaC component
MKKLLTIAFALVLGSALSFAQAGSTTPAPSSTDTAKSGTTKTKKHSHAKKGGKKAKKAAADTTAPAPK